MADKPENPPAFPILPPLDEAGHTPSGYPYPSDGMSLRDWFAGMALNGVITTCCGDPRRDGETVEQYIARKAHDIADAMLSERTKPNE